MSNPLNLSIVNPTTSGAKASEIYVCILGTDPSDSTKFGYLDFSTNQFVFSTASSWMLDPTTMVQTLDKLGTAVSVPKITSARIYISVYDNFAAFPASGPSPSAGNTVMFDKIEFDTATNPNINGTSVDFYGISYTITATDTNTGNPVTVGYAASRDTIISAFNKIPVPSNAQQHSGNTGIFQDVMLNNGSNITRILAPKTAALTDWGATPTDYDLHATQSSHFFDDYINNECWKPNRTFSCYSKLYNPANPTVNNTVYYGKVNSTGTEINLYTNKGMTTPYVVPTLPRPSNAWPDPNFATSPSLYNNTNSATGAVDWGFLLSGNAGYSSGLGEYWNSDPVAMAIMVSICRGVMHLDDGCTDWTDSTKYYLGDGTGKSTSSLPIFYYSSILHANGLNGKAYVLSYDDIYGEEPTIYFANYPDVTITLNSVAKVTAATVNKTKLSMV